MSTGNFPSQAKPSPVAIATEQDPLQQAIHEISLLSGKNYFDLLVEKLSELVEADYTLISQLDKDISRVNSLAFWGKGRRLENIEYTLAGTPCENLVSECVCCFPDSVQSLYPQDQFLTDYHIESYIGVVLRNSEGKKIGLLVALFEKKIGDPRLKTDLFQLFTLRAAAEVERYRYELQLISQVNELRDKNKRLNVAQQVYDFTSDGVIVTDTENRIVFVNRSMERICGYSERELVGRNPRILNSGLQAEDFYKNLWDSLTDRGYWQGELWNRHKNGKTYPILSAISVIPGANGKPQNHVAIHRDISGEKRAQELISFQATHDQLTELLNRFEFNGQLEHQLAHSKRQDEIGAFLLLDIDNFKSVNDSMGHLSGDELLKQVALRLKRRLRNDDLLARLGGDEFAIFANFDNVSGIEALASKLLELFSEPFVLEHGGILTVTTSIGISLFGVDAEDTKGLFSCADQALYQAKDNGRNNFVFFTEELRVKALRSQRVRQRLLLVLEQGGIEPYFQPIIHIASGEILHCEALARWQDKELGTVPPDEFIAVAENSGLIQQLGRQLTAKVIRQVKNLNDQRQTPITVAINRSPQEFMDRGDKVDPVVALAEQIGLPAEQIAIELTESLMVKNPELARRYLSELRARGLKLYMDDFGTGYSSLAYLKHFPFDRLKIDRSFIADITAGRDDYVLVKTIIDMAHNFGMQTIAEGVETQEQLAVLRELHCDFAQGYLISKPLPIAELREFLQRYEASTWERIQ